MKYLPLVLLLSLSTTQVFAIAEEALEESQNGIQVVDEPTLTIKATESTHDLKPMGDPKKKLFLKKRSTPNNVNLTSSKEKENELDVYHIDIKKEGPNNYSKTEKLIVFDKNHDGDKVIKEVVKCGSRQAPNGAQFKCQSFNHDFCESLIAKHQRIVAMGENDTNTPVISEIQSIYSQHGHDSIKPELTEKMNTLSRESIQKIEEDPNLRLNEEMKGKINQKLASHPILAQFKKKFHDDLMECYSLRSSLKPKPSRSNRPNNSGSSNDVNRQ